MHTVSRGKEENLKSLQKHDTMLLGKLPVMDRTGGPPPNAVFLQHADIAGHTSCIRDKGPD